MGRCLEGGGALRWGCLERGCLERGGVAGG